jgi:hypothetical protein
MKLFTVEGLLECIWRLSGRRFVGQCGKFRFCWGGNGYREWRVLYGRK